MTNLRPTNGRPQKTGQLAQNTGQTAHKTGQTAHKTGQTAAFFGQHFAQIRRRLPLTNISTHGLFVFTHSQSIIIIIMSFSMGSQEGSNKKRASSGSVPPAQATARRRFGSSSARGPPSPGSSLGGLGSLPSVSENFAIAAAVPTSLRLQYSQQSNNSSVGASGASVGFGDGQDQGQDHDGTSVLSADSSMEDELYKKYLPQALSVRSLVGDDCVELQLANITDADPAPDVPAMIRNICENPRKSLIAQMGLYNIQVGVKVLQTHHAKWSMSAAGYTSLIEEARLEEHRLQATVDEHYELLKDANTNYFALSTQQSKNVAARQTYEEHYHHYERRCKISKILIEILLTFEGGRETETVSLILILPWLGLGIGNQIATNPFILTQWAVNVEIATVRALLGLESWEDCQELGRDACVGVLHILQVFRFDRTDFFRGLWEIPPGMGRDAWFDLYDFTPKIKSGKGSSKADTFREQVGHFLGFQGLSRVGVVRADTLTDEAIDASMKELLAEQARRRATQANASTRTSVGGGLAASQASDEALFGGANTQG
jgi:hypothetical protein